MDTMDQRAPPMWDSESPHSCVASVNLPSCTNLHRAIGATYVLMFGLNVTALLIYRCSVEWSRRAPACEWVRPGPSSWFAARSLPAEAEGEGGAERVVRRIVVTPWRRGTTR